MYFGFGSNMQISSLRAKGVEPHRSEQAALRGWRLRFNVQHFFRHEGGVGNVEPSDDPNDVVLGVVHLCEEAHLPSLDGAEAFGHGYDRRQVVVHTASGPVEAVTYVGMSSFINDACLPAARYLNILVAGAKNAGIDPDYVARLRDHPVHQKKPYPPFVHPPGDWPVIDARALAEKPLWTALDGGVFDMSGARPQHEFLKGYFGGRDMTLFHLKRMDTTDGKECWEDILAGRLSPGQRAYLDEYLHEYSSEYVYVARCHGGPA